MRIFINTIIILIALFSTKIVADPASDLSSLMGPLHTLRANFTQTVYDTRDKAIQHSTGKMALSRPGKFRWDVDKPLEQTIVANGSKLWIYDPDLQQVTIRFLNQAAGQSPALLLSDVGSALSKDYAIEELNGTKDELRWFKLTPKQKDSGFESVQLAFDFKTIRKMTLQDNLGHTTKIDFHNAKINTALASAVFNFKPPANVDVLDETRKR